MVEERTKHTILIVEDDSPTLDVLVDKLTLEGFNTLQARDGEEGLLIANRDHPDILLLDIIMPKMDGFTLAKKIRMIDKTEYFINLAIKSKLLLQLPMHCIFQ